MGFNKIIYEQVGYLPCCDALALCEFYGKVINVEFILGGIKVTYENGKAYTFIRRDNLS